MARCNTCFTETPLYWHGLHGHYCSKRCAEHAAGFVTIDLGSLVQSHVEDTNNSFDSLDTGAPE